MPKVTKADVLAARHPDCGWPEARIDSEWSGRPAELELSALISEYLSAPASEHKARSYVIRKLMPKGVRVGVLRSLDPTRYMEACSKALAGS